MSRNLAVLSLVLSMALCAGISSGETPGALSDPLAPVTTRGSAAEKRFSAVVSEYSRGFFAFEPGFATTWGIHRYDDRLEDLSRAAIDREVARTRRAVAAAKGINAAQLSDSARIDYDLFTRQVEGHLFDLTEIRRWENDPSSYNYAGAIFALMARSFAPAETRLALVTARLKQVPRLLESGKRNLKNPPAMFANFAAEDFEGSIDFLDHEVPAAFAAVKDTALLNRYEEAKKIAEAATRDYVQWIRKDLVPRANGTYVLGAERYRKKLYYDEMVDLPIDSLLHVGEQELNRLEARYASCAKRID
ncbi:MAG TPA: DUF885 family protein, partial [Methylomirabilota bacterium]|nr:DUF885 family protein [Methylomirabilota bacterium]